MSGSASAQRAGKHPKVRKTKNQKKREKKKQQRLQSKLQTEEKEPENNTTTTTPDNDAKTNVEVEYVAVDLAKEVAHLGDFSNVFEKFMKPEELTQNDKGDKSNSKQQLEDDESKENGEEDTQQAKSAENAETKKMTKRERKEMLRLQIAQLKKVVAHPDLVEPHDVTSSDPKFLVYLKSIRNTVSVPRHWLQKRKYLQGKRGIEKPPFELPSYIADTGIGKVRSNVEEDVKSKTKQRERMKPKMGKIDLDYQVLMDAFFKYQTKPKMSKHGDLYYEGKEFEVQVKEKIPGKLSEGLRESLGIPPGAPPPWLVHMQRVGPPPSYPNLRIPGLNAPIPKGAKWGFDTGGWGQAPVGPDNLPLYGDVFGHYSSRADKMAPVDKTVWGELQEDEESVEDSDSSDEEEEDEYSAMPRAPEVPRTAQPSGVELAKGTASVARMEVPDQPEGTGVLDLRKGSQSVAPPEAPKTLYKVLPAQAATVGEDSLYGASHTYVVSDGKEAESADQKRKREDDGDADTKLKKKKKKKKNAEDDDEFERFKF